MKEEGAGEKVSEIEIKNSNIQAMMEMQEEDLLRLIMIEWLCLK